MKFPFSILMYSLIVTTAAVMPRVPRSKPSTTSTNLPEGGFGGGNSGLADRFSAFVEEGKTREGFAAPVLPTRLPPFGVVQSGMAP